MALDKAFVTAHLMDVCVLQRKSMADVVIRAYVEAHKAKEKAHEDWEDG